MGEINYATRTNFFAASRNESRQVRPKTILSQLYSIIHNFEFSPKLAIASPLLVPCCWPSQRAYKLAMIQTLLSRAEETLTLLGINDLKIKNLLESIYPKKYIYIYIKYLIGARSHT